MTDEDREVRLSDVLVASSAHAASRPESVRALLDAPPESALRAARLALALNVAPALYASLRSLALEDRAPEPARELLEAAYLLNRERNRAIVRQCRELTELLAEIDVQPVFLKGACHLLTGVHGDPGARVVGDVDVLTPRERVLDAFAHLRARGFAPTKTYYGEALSPRGHQMAPLARPDDRASVELHHRFVSGARGGLLQNIAERAKPAPDLPLARAPCPEDQLAIAAAHASVRSDGILAGVIKARDLLDAAAISMRSQVSLTALGPVFDRAHAGRRLRAFAWRIGRDLDDWGPWRALRRPGPRGGWGDVALARWCDALRASPSLARANQWGMRQRGRAFALASDPLYRRHFAQFALNEDYRRTWLAR